MGFIRLQSGFAIASLVLALAATILLYIFVFPRSKAGTLPKFFVFVRDFFDMKYLIIEKIAKYLYVFATLLIILEGFFMLFSSFTVLYAPFVIVLGPVFIRLFYELFMMIVLLVKNVMEINSKLKGSAEGATSVFDAMPDIPRSAPKPAAAPAPQPPLQPAEPAQPVQPQQSAQKVCPNCGTPLFGTGAFCPKCGQRLQ